ncbi:hypothetical protein Goshw_003762 [Gossypium schwendimanii]|uniref:Dirigent protein n=1 Tax=Gossypium schwendimanii TaxID=34291 RepID=A0A7J9MLZ7_GOSSC|nr:hypothetical protein [Gossypium schwendimanii]
MTSRYPVTVGPNLTSEVVTNARGRWVSTDPDVLTLVLYMDFGFTKGELNGYSINIFSRNPIAETELELAVIGGRGKFKVLMEVNNDGSRTLAILVKRWQRRQSSGDAFADVVRSNGA